MKVKFLLSNLVAAMVLLTFVAPPEIYAQANCTNPPNCILNPGLLYTSTPFGDPVGTTLPDWWVLSGNPIFRAGSLNTHGFQLTNGDGMYTCYNFVPGRTYRICLLGYSLTQQSGTIQLQAHNGTTGVSITMGIVNKIGLPIDDVILNSNTFIPGSSFSQLRVFVNSSGTDVVLDDIQIIEVPTLSATPSTINGCGSTTLFANSNNPLDITWSDNTGTIGTGTQITVSPCQTTTYTATYNSSVCTLYGCKNFTKQITVTVNPGVNVTASPSTIDVCGSSTLTANSTNPMNVTWSPSTGLIGGSGNTVIASPCKTTTYKATFRCSNGCIYFDSVTVNVQPNGTILDSSSSACYGPINLEYVPNTPCPGSTYRWFGPKNPGILLSTQSKLYMPSSTPGDMGNFMVEVTTPQGCVDTIYTPVVMDCCDATADFNPMDCNPVRFENFTQDSLGNIIMQGEWYWDFGDGTTSTLRNPSHLYTSQLGPHTVCLTAVVSDGLSTCCSKICKEIEVCDFGGCPKAAFDYRVVNPGAGDVQFLDRSVGGGIDCGWTWKVNGIPRAWTQNPTITLGGPGTYNICLEACRENGGAQRCYEEWCEDIIIP